MHLREVGRRVDVEGEAREVDDDVRDAEAGVDGALCGSPKCVCTRPGGRIATAFVPPSSARPIAMPRSGVAASSASTSSARSSGRSAEIDGDERRAHVLHRSGERVVPGKPRVEPGVVAVDGLAGDDRDPVDPGLVDHADDSLQKRRASGSVRSLGREHVRETALRIDRLQRDEHMGVHRVTLSAGTYAHRVLDRPLEELLSEARSLRESTVVTYSPKVFIPLTKLCRDVCHYCTFAGPPRRGERAYLAPDEVLDIARAGAAAGCTEALFTLGDKPELRYKVAREELRALGCETTIEYLTRMCELVLEETGLLPHANPGVMSRDELAALREVTASQGIMLETASDRLSARGGPHFGSPDKQPAARLETLRLAGELRVPFTTGILIGIGETREERIEALEAIAGLHREHGHIQEVIVQNFRAKPGTKMAGHAEPRSTTCSGRPRSRGSCCPADVHVQCPPNLSYDDFPRLLDAGIDDWGGVSPVTIDHVNPEAPWPEIERLRAATEAAGSRSRRGCRSTPSSSTRCGSSRAC